MKVKPMGMLLMMLASWMNRHQQDMTMKSVCRWFEINSAPNGPFLGFRSHRIAISTKVTCSIGSGTFDAASQGAALMYDEADSAGPPTYLG